MLTANLRTFATQPATVVALTGHETQYQLLSIDGLAPAPAQINTTAGAGIDGTRFNSAQLNERNIVITVRLNEPQTVRQLWEDYFAPKSAVRLTVLVGTRDVYIDGYVETFECSPYSKSVIAQISIICPDPYFRSTSPQIMTLEGSAGSFRSASIIPNGLDITVTITSVNRVNSVAITNDIANETITIDHIFDQGDVIKICTKQGYKSATLTHAGVTTNIIGDITPGSQWISCRAGQMTFSYAINGTALETDRATISIEYQEIYAGV